MQTIIEELLNMNTITTRRAAKMLVEQHQQWQEDLKVRLKLEAIEAVTFEEAKEIIDYVVNQEAIEAIG